MRHPHSRHSETPVNVKQLLARLGRLTALRETDEVDLDSLSSIVHRLRQGQYSISVQQHIAVHIRMLVGRSDRVRQLLQPLLERFPLNPVTS